MTISDKVFILTVVETMLEHKEKLDIYVEIHKTKSQQ